MVISFEQSLELFICFNHKKWFWGVLWEHESFSIRYF